MQILNLSTDIIFIKTAKGRKEAVRSHYLLNERQHRVLMSIDECKNFDKLAEKIPMSELVEEVSFLVKEGFIVPAEKQIIKAKLDRLKNPEIFTEKCRGGFASSADFRSKVRLSH